MASRERRGRLLSVESIAGWVFADLLLVLFLVGLGSAQPAPAAPPEPEPVVQVEPEPAIVGMQTDPRSVVISFDGTAILDAGDRQETAERQVCRAIGRATRPFDDEKAALVLVFGGASDVGVGQDVARRVGAQLHCGDGAVFARNTPQRAFWDGALPQGRARLEVFLFTTESTP